MTKIQKSKQWLAFKGFGHWILEFEIYLRFGAFNLCIFNTIPHGGAKELLPDPKDPVFQN